MTADTAVVMASATSNASHRNAVKMKKWDAPWWKLHMGYAMLENTSAMTKINGSDTNVLDRTYGMTCACGMEGESE